MTAVKSLKVTAATYRHRGWMWKDRAAYESFKSYMKLPLWVDRILTSSDDSQRFVVGSKDGMRNAVCIGETHCSEWRIPDERPSLMSYNCNTKPGNGFVVLAERIRAKKPDANKVPRPQWRQPMSKPWEPGTLKGKWVLDSKLVKEVGLNVVVPERADRLYISTSGGTDSLVWVDSTTLKPTPGVPGQEHQQAAWAQGVVGIKGHQRTSDYKHNEVLLAEDCHWQLAGVRKKTVQVPAPEVVKPLPVATTGAVTRRVASLSTLMAAPYGTDIYSKIAQELDISRGAAKARVHHAMYTGPKPSLVFNPSLVAFAELAWLAATRPAPKPPIGVKPRNLHDEERANALDEAMVHYLNEDLPFPIEWATEWNELRARLNKEQK